MAVLDGVKILDLSQHMPGHYCTMLLSDMGAEVLKIEEPFASARRAGSHLNQGSNQRTLAFNALNRNKRSIAINLKEERGRQIIYKLTQQADAVLEGYRPGVVDRLGVDYKTLSEVNPRIVYASITGYGQTGPYKMIAGHDINYTGEGGALAMIGWGPDDPPAIPMNFLADLAGGATMAALGIAAALFRREQTGRGQYIDVSMTDGVTQLATAMLMRSFENNTRLVRGRESFSGSTLYYNVYQCSDGKWISVGCIEPWFYENMCRVLGKEEWIPLQQADLGTQAEMIAEARRIFTTRTRDEWYQAMNEHDLCVQRILESDELADDPQIKAREMIVERQHPEFGPVKQVGTALKFSEGTAPFTSFAPEKGQHTDEVLSQIGYAAEEIASLRNDKVVV